MTDKREETKPFAVDTIQFAPCPNDDADTVWTEKNRPSDFEEVPDPDDDKKGRTKWIR